MSNVECSISNVKVIIPQVAEALEAAVGIHAAFESLRQRRQRVPALRTASRT
jgi:hypothetical protein